MLLAMAELGWCAGFVIRTRENNLVFDPNSTHSLARDSSVFISHAHADHSAGFRSRLKKYSTVETREIFESIHGRAVVNFHDVELHCPIRLGDAEITPLNAGHMLGSTQFLVTLPNTTILYTGDINCLDTLTTTRAERAECDTLVVEATYGEPSYIFPEREQTYAKIVSWALDQIKQGLAPTFQAYGAGKAQELVKLFNIYTKLDVITDQKIAGINAVYSNNGLKMFSRMAAAEEPNNDDSVLIATRPYFLSDSRKYVKAVTTGWALKMSPKRAAAFPLSSHADYRQILQFVKDSKAKTVYGFTGYTDVLATQIRKELGIQSRPLPMLAQKTLHHFR
jgi:putative mRNA 3-end processing factor